MSERVRAFGNGEAYRQWTYNNCRLCLSAPSCDLEEALASACVLDGTVSAEVAARLGKPANGSDRWWCDEQRLEQTGGGSAKGGGL